MVQDKAVLCVKGTVQEDNRDETATQFSIREVSLPDVSLMAGEGGVVIPVRNREEQTRVLAFVMEHPGLSRVTLKAYDELFPLRLLVHASPENKQIISTIINAPLE